MKKVTLLRPVILVLLFLAGCKGEEKYSDVSGVWDTEWGKMTLTQSQSGEVAGTYEHMKGRLKGTLKDTVLAGDWKQINTEGTFVFHFDRKFTEFEGKWGYNDEVPSRDWDGTRAE